MSPQDKSGRSAAHRRAAQAAAREAARRKQRRFRAIVAGIVAAIVVLAVVLATVPNGGGDDDDQADTPTTTTTAADTSTSEVPVAEDTVIPDDPSENTSPPFEYGTAECAPDTKPATRPDTFAAAPKKCIKDDVDYKAVVDTSEGSFTIDLLEHRAPGTVNNFVELAKWGWYDGDDFHRVVKGFVDQAGDPVGDPPGTGGPGYTIADELPPAVQSYARGAIAMANSGPNTNGSQWFACVDCSKLPNPAYSLFGQVVEGMDVVQAINDLGQDDQTPSKPVTIKTVTIVEG
jgi:cyclophilin family peptidyl-prolyl cis-trans isomerase